MSSANYSPILRQLSTFEDFSLERPESLLKSALEKVVFFECRLDQRTSDLARSQGEIDQLRGDLAQAAQREVALRQELAAAESRAGTHRRERDQALESAAAARADRERFLDKLIEAERIRRAGEEHNEEIDLAAFIAELRSEVINLRANNQNKTPSNPIAISNNPPCQPMVVNFRSAQEAANALASQGRLTIGERDRQELQANARFETKSEETLFALSLRELSSTEPISRARAAQRLKALGPKAALPAVAAALNAEQSPEVLCALLDVCGAAAEPSVMPLVEAKANWPMVEVRLASLEAAYRLGHENCLTRALGDESPAVRRRAAILAASKNVNVGVLEKAAADSDPSVRRVAALGLAATESCHAQSTLITALDDADLTVRRAAARGLSRNFGPHVFAIADLDAARRKREIRRLSNKPATSTQIVDNDNHQNSVSKPNNFLDHPAEAAKPEITPSSSDTASSQFETEIVAQVYAALRGKTSEEIAHSLDKSDEQVAASALALVQQGRLVRRGHRYFVP